ncbi:hypothetical protein Q8W71_16620 [Methylobacterium sp. NEAU 140]|uniref:hypothetical protein n=1 Tax=Methylobacterium sp. NEAU 140 TaxID=3064945 RepID=UPI00273703D7|nr:hypothetical protein [Methylobacterium sp. NEAU 140]MDP4024255.1 hypothetical protein [Methylobacterium sp. NEAU 140]
MAAVGDEGAQDTGRGEAPEPAQDAAWLALHAEREALERALALAQARQRYGRDTAEVARARAEEAAMLVDLDRVLTRIRAAEYRRRPGARRW